MQEKDIRKKLNQELNEMAPDIFDKICSTPIEKINDEKELLGDDRPLFVKDKKKVYFIAPAFTALAACVLLLVVILTRTPMQNQPNNMVVKSAFQVTIDVNPSVMLEVDDKGKLVGVQAQNKDAKKIVKAVNKKINDDTTYQEGIELVISQINKAGYFKKKNKAMLVSVVSDNKKDCKDVIKKIEKDTNSFEQKEEIHSKNLYQNCEETKELKKIAKENNVSVGKASLCVKIAEKENKSVKKMCKKSIDSLIDVAEKNGTVKKKEIVIISELETETETESESETIVEESIIETESETGEEIIETEPVSDAGEIPTAEDAMQEDVETQAEVQEETNA